MKDSLQIRFNGSPNPTLGVELELFTLDKDTLELTDGAPKILEHFKDNFFFKQELLQSIIEITTDTKNAPITGVTIFEMIAKISVNQEITAKLSDKLNQLESKLGLDISLNKI